ncbi:ELMO domain-containing protein 1 [Allomyces arbusculus]|nr:ELMO domain-containing protein 1 [Allomyces arbusculus]
MLAEPGNDAAAANFSTSAAASADQTSSPIPFLAITTLFALSAVVLNYLGAMQPLTNLVLLLLPPPTHATVGTAGTSPAGRARLVARAYVASRPWLRPVYRLVKYLYGLVTRTTELYRLCAAEVKRQREARGEHVREGHGRRTRRVGPASKDGGVEEDDDEDALKRPLLEDHDGEDDGEQHCREGGAMLPVSCDAIAEIEMSLLYSKELTLERRSIESRECGLEEVTQMILYKKHFPGRSSLETPEARVLFAAVSVIHEAHRVVADINARAATKYDAANRTHERKLLELWSLLMPGEPLEARVTSQWGKIGFQGKDPATDFRGMGMQALDDLVYFAKVHPTVAKAVLAASQHPVSWYSFAIVGINVTSYVVQTLRTRRLQYYMLLHGPARETVHEFYCYVFKSFNDHWTGYTGNPPLTIMDFEREFAIVRHRIDQDLVLYRPGMRLAADPVSEQ